MTGTALLTAQNLGVTLGGRAVLRDVSLSLSSGHLVALVGPNGAGKTTLLRALAGLLPSQGEVRVGGEPLSSLRLRERARRFAYLPQGQWCIGRCRCGISWRLAAFRTARPIRRG